MADKSGKETIIGSETRISGEVRGEEDLSVRGRIDGKIQLSQTLTVEAGGVVQADIDVREIVISGVVLGNVTASESVRLTDKARVIGNLSAPRIIIEAGAAYRGRVEMGDLGVPRAAAAKRQVVTRDKAATGSARQAPRLAPPPRAAAVAASSPTAPRIGGAIAVGASNGSPIRATGPVAQRVVSASVPRTAVPPTLARPEALVGGASSPGWAKKKLRKR
jgi:cytoskeletal protein CcmA (bactofilin family)